MGKADGLEIAIHLLDAAFGDFQPEVHAVALDGGGGLPSRLAELEKVVSDRRREDEQSKLHLRRLISQVDVVGGAVISGGSNRERGLASVQIGMEVADVVHRLERLAYSEDGRGERSKVAGRGQRGVPVDREFEQVRLGDADGVKIGEAGLVRLGFDVSRTPHGVIGAAVKGPVGVLRWNMAGDEECGDLGVGDGKTEGTCPALVDDRIDGNGHTVESVGGGAEIEAGRVRQIAARIEIEREKQVLLMAG